MLERLALAAERHVLNYETYTSGSPFPLREDLDIAQAFLDTVREVNPSGKEAQIERNGSGSGNVEELANAGKQDHAGG